MKTIQSIFATIFTYLLITSAISCKEESLSSTPKVETINVTIITANIVICEGKITSYNEGEIKSRGFCWSTNQYPTITDNKTTEMGNVGVFISSISGLSRATKYYIRAYAINSFGAFYGNQIAITTLDIQSTVTDIDGNIYYTVPIGKQVWMAENLKTTKYRNGDLIGTTSPANLDITSQTSPKYQWAYDGDEGNNKIYGRLYTSYAVVDIRNICPTGWHLPTDLEWKTLSNYLGGELIAGGKLKESGTSHWTSPNSGANNMCGFTALPGGYRHFSGSFHFIGRYGYWWSATEDHTGTIWTRTMYYSLSELSRTGFDSDAYANSVRCIKD